MNSIESRFEVVVIGGTPGGIAAAIAAARLGRQVLLVESHRRIGGMSASGLGKSDVEKRHLIGGIFQDFTSRIKCHYKEQFAQASEDYQLCQDGYYFEPSVAEKVFSDMLGEYPNLELLTHHRLTSARVETDTLRAVEIIDIDSGIAREINAPVFIDATYEGDLLAAAGAEFRVGRESRDQFGEPHAGEIYFDYQSAEILPGTTGAGDQRIPAYTYRLCLSTRADNSRQLESPPEDYDRNHYTGYFDDLAAGRLAGPKNLKPGRGYEPSHFNTLVRALSVTPLPNDKTDVNINPRPLGFPFAEENAGFLEGSAEVREVICRRIRNLTLGLLYFLQNDPEIPEGHRKIANRYHLPKDEFTDTGNFPFQLYVREGRRLVGEYTLTECDITTLGEGKTDERYDAVAIGEFPIDSFPCRKRQPEDSVVLEGYLGMLDSITRPYQIPYRIMIPQRIDGLIVPVAASTTHVAFSSIRMEPTWMALGQAAGTAAHLSWATGEKLRNVPIARMQKQLTDDGQILKHFESQTENLTECSI